ncbi:hypothetical protein GCM10009430_14450 [Aquimarina litoralis]|uniref:Uncharacterized protein n=1 Tax=Aquimarina litoralis TaxID=584605 RepID=A0ABN1IND6_9FLAO
MHSVTYTDNTYDASEATIVLFPRSIYYEETQKLMCFKGGLQLIKRDLYRYSYTVYSLGIIKSAYDSLLTIIIYMFNFCWKNTKVIFKTFGKIGR